MKLPSFCCVVRGSLPLLLLISLLTIAQSQGGKKSTFDRPTADADADHMGQRAEWFLRGRVIPGKSAADLRHRAYQTKMRARSARGARAHVLQPNSQPLLAVSGGWPPLGPVPLAAPPTANGLHDYPHLPARATARPTNPPHPS